MKGRIAEISLVVAMLLWASSFIALKIAFQSYDPWTVIAGRMIVASVCFLCFWRKLLKFHYQSGDWKLLLLLVAAEPCLYFIFEALALQYTTAGQAGMITSLAPLLTAVIAFFVLKEKISKIASLGLGIAIIGVLVLGSEGHSSETAPNPMLGNSLEFLAMLCAAVFSICLKILSERYSALTMTALMSFTGMLFFTPIALLQGNAWSWDAQGLTAIVFLGGFVTIGAYLLYNYAISHMPVTRAAGFINLIPVFTLVLAYLILDERLSPMQIGACAIVMFGVGLSQFKSKGETPAQVFAEPEN